MTTGNGDASQFSIVAERSVPDVYADSVQFEVTIYGFTLQFGKAQPPPSGFKGKVPSIPRVRVHMSPQHAKVLAAMMRKNVKAYEENAGPIALPAGFLQELHLSEEDL